MIERKTVWTEAGLPGLVLGLVPVAVLVLNTIASSPVLGVVLWLVKFVGCIYLMYLFMKKFVSIHDDADNSDSFRFGVVVALLSAFIYSASYFVYAAYIKPDLFETAIATAMDSYSSMLDANTLESMENLIPKMPTITFFVNLVYCFVFGTIVSAVISRSVPSSNPFDSDKTNNI